MKWDSFTGPSSHNAFHDNGGRSVPVEWRHCSNFKYVLTQSQKKSCSPFWLRDSRFSVWSLCRPQGEQDTVRAEYSLCAFFDISFSRSWESAHSFEISFHSKIEALISQHLRLMKSHKWSMRIPAWLAGFLSASYFPFWCPKLDFLLFPFWL